MNLSWRYIPAIPAALTVAAAGGAFQRVFGWSQVVGPVIAAVLLGAAAGVAGRQALDRQNLQARRAVAAVAVAAATFISVTLAAAVCATPAPPGLGAAMARGVGAVFGGWSRILTTSVPVPASADRLPIIGLLTPATAWAVLAATRRRPGLDALLPAGLTLLAGLLLGVHGPGSVAAVAGPPLALAAVYLLLISRPAGEGMVWVPPGRIVAATSTAAIVVAVSLAAGTHLPLASLRQPVDLRTALSPPVDLGNTPNPLDQLGAWQRESGTVMFTAAVDPAWLHAPPDWRLVSLDLYDGTGWSTQASARRAGPALLLPPGVSPRFLGPEVHATVHIRALTAPWVPTAGVPIAVTPADLAFDPASSDLVRNGKTFAVTGRLTEPSRSELDAAGVASAAAVVALTAVPACFPAALRSLAAKATAGLERPDQQAVAVEQALAARSGFRLDASATPGSSCARLSAVALTRSGTAEQYATAFALMVRSVGLPARLAVGFQPGAIDVAHGQTVVRGSDATVWPEVELGRLGWVAFDPVPSSRTGGAGPGGRVTTTVPASQQGLNQVRQSVTASGPPAGRPAAAPARRTRGGMAWLGMAWLAILGLAVAAALLLGVAGRILARRHRRAMRRMAPDPGKRVLGAWSELLESLRPFRVGVSSLTPSEVSAIATELAPPAGDPSKQLAQLVDEAVYAGMVDDDSAARAWTASDLAVGALAQATPTGRRVRHLLIGFAARR